MRQPRSSPPLEHWQRLSPWAVGLLLITSVITQVRQHLPVVLGAGAGLAFIERIGFYEVLLGGALLLLAAVLLSLLYYRRFRFRLDDEVLVIQKGLFEHREFKVAAHHVQHIAVHQPVYMRPFGVVQWQVETLAGEASRIELPGIRRDLADALSQRLGGSTPPVAGATGGLQQAERDERIRFAITPWALTLHGLTSRSIYLIAAMLSPLVQPLEHWVQEYLPRAGAWRWLLDSPGVVLSLGVVTLVVILAALAVIAAWWRFHGYVLRDDGERQVQVSGLLQRQEQALSLRRLQVVEWVQTGLGRVLGRGYLVCHQFGTPAGSGAEEGRRFLVPGLTGAQGQELTRLLWPGVSMDSPLARVTVIYRRVLFLRLLLAMITGLVGLAWLAGEARPSLPVWGWGLLALFLIGMAGAVAHLRWKALGWVREGFHMRVRQGLWGQRTSIFPLHNVISVSIQQSWLQRRRGLATLHLFLANGKLTLPFLEKTAALALADRLLASVEAPPQVG
ncbi:PH domain-containing protein [Litchfieldella rifensis]|uniref:PH domain-containing protein n=1 Tax=Litchfieldella rifensis TaxID=762643 RepID=A0ABV7LN43_9GAMM